MSSILSDSAILAGENLIFEKTLSTESGYRLTTNSFAGNIKVTTSASNEVTVKAYCNEEAKDKLDISAENSSGGVTVDVKKKPGAKLNSCNFRLEITVPSSYNVSLKTGGGNLSVTSLTGKMDLRSQGGNINLENSSGETIASTQGGNISLKTFEGNVTAETNGGNIKLSGSNGSVSASTNGGNITLDYTGSNNGISLNTSAGNINVEIPAEFNADVDLSTAVGKIVSDFGNPSDKHIGSNLKTTIGSGGNKLVCSTNAGTIIVNKK